MGHETIRITQDVGTATTQGHRPNDFKGHTANGMPRTKQDIRLGLHGNTRRLRRSQDKLRSFILSSDLPSAPW